jgi:hypothetical protein
MAPLTVRAPVGHSSRLDVTELELAVDDHLFVEDCAHPWNRRVDVEEAEGVLVHREPFFGGHRSLERLPAFEPALGEAVELEG